MSQVKLNIRAVMLGLGRVAAWVVVILVIIVFLGRGREHYETLKVEQLYITIADSTSNGNLITTPMILRTLQSAKIKSVGERVSTLPLTKIEQSISKNGFVESVRAYANYFGDLNIEIHQRSAAARLLLDGYNCYISSSGYIFNAPPTTALYTPVVTGSYRPLFGKSYLGSIDEYCESKIAELELEIERIEREKYPIYERERKNNEDKREVRRRYINRSVFEDRDEFARKVVELREENRKRRELYSYRQRVIDGELQAIAKRQDGVRERQKKLQKSCDDIHNLITFVEMVEEDDFWRSEIVQIILTQGEDGHMRIALAVRSANFRVHLGSLLSRDDWEGSILELDKGSSASSLRGVLPSSTTSKRVRAEISRKERKRQQQLVERSVRSKLARLEEFYREALPRVGWERYKEINIEFENQVVCKK